MDIQGKKAFNEYMKKYMKEYRKTEKGKQVVKDTNARYWSKRSQEKKITKEDNND